MRVRTHAEKLFVALIAGAALLTMAGPSMASTTFTTNLSGANEVPGPGDPNGTGEARITVFPNLEKVCYRLEWHAIRQPMAAHIHRGHVGAAGPVKVALFVSHRPLPRPIDTVLGCVKNVDQDLLERIENHPARFYVNLHNRAYPDGALRGQLA
jgi:hypothetical protein